ncbi:MAG: flagellar FlbD family protein [Planctomycetes bacterium]|nr:flagellar FlbD family protein [Planctomycetota bacterium]
MIRLTRLDGEDFILNADLIKYVEHRPDTFITLTSNDRIVVAETPDEVLERTIDYQRNKRLLPDTCNG